MKFPVIASVMMLVTLFACKHDTRPVMPNFSFRLSDSTTIMKTSQIPTGQPIVLIHFEADCNDCQQMTDSLLSSINGMSQIRFYFLTSERFSQVTLFSNYYKLGNYSNVSVGQDYEKVLNKYFDTYSTPAIAMFDGDKKLLGVVKGKIPNEQLLDLIKSIQ